MAQADAASKLAAEEARVRGNEMIANSIIAMQEKLNEIAEKRFAIIAYGTMQLVREVENFYGELIAKINDDNEKYSREKLPALLAILEQYPEGSAPHRLYEKHIEQDFQRQCEYTTIQLKAALQRQDKIISATESLKEKVFAQTDQITAGLLEAMHQRTEAISAGSNHGVPSLPEMKDIPALPV